MMEENACMKCKCFHTSEGLISIAMLDTIHISWLDLVGGDHDHQETQFLCKVLCHLQKV